MGILRLSNISVPLHTWIYYKVKISGVQVDSFSTSKWAKTESFYRLKPITGEGWFVFDTYHGASGNSGWELKHLRCDPLTCPCL